jgi:hypothetical protein
MPHMDNPPSTPGDRKDPEIAAAEWLLRNAESPGAGSTQPAGPVIAPGSSEGFELADVPEPAATAPPFSGAVGPREAASGEQAESRPRKRMVTPSAPAVEQVWSRGSEWGSTLVVLACWSAAILGLAYFTLGAEHYEMTGLILLVGGLGAVVLSYPILITLERPVRITPEQAARDYFGALSHHFPHYRRMWLLLSARGRTSAQFASYEGFKAYWTQRQDQLREGHAGRFAPLVFQVEEFRADKSAGKTEIDSRFKVKVLVRGRRKEGPIWSLSLERSMVRGPDGMWYLDDGTLAERA